MSDPRVIVITGASRGLGQALVEQFVHSGHTVFGCARTPSRVDQLNARYAAPHAFSIVDVSDDAQVEQWCADVLARADAPDLLLNNAAVINRSRPLWDVPPDEFSRLVDINLKGMYYVLRHFVPAMIRRQTGVIVNFSSTWGRTVSADVAPYCATKWAVEGLTRALAAELPAGLAAVPFNPGVIHTEMLESCFGAAASSYPQPTAWAARAAPMLLSLGPAHNGQPCSPE